MIENILANLKIERLNPMQEASINAWKEGKDLILLSPTGSGKTLAYLLPLVQSLKPGITGVQAIVLVPSRELALQIDQVFKSMNTPFKAVSCYGGRPAMEEHRTIKGVQPSVIIGTPGRMNDHLSKQNFDADTVTTLVIDEFDKCLEFGFQEEMATVIGQLPNLQRRFLLSATDAEEIPQFTGLDKTIKLNFLNPEEQLTHRLHLYKVLSPEKDKLETLYKLLCTLGSQSTLVFCNHRESVERVRQFLTDRGIIAEAFHGGMEQADRERALCKFRNHSSYICISTDLAARGLDIPEVKYIVHYHLPVDFESFTHRNGRTARMHAEGEAFIILGPTEQMPEYATEATDFRIDPKANFLQTPPMATFHFAAGKKEKISKGDIVGFLTQKGKLAADEIGLIEIKDHYSYVAVTRDKAHETLTRLKNEKIKGKKVKISFGY